MPRIIKFTRRKKELAWDLFQKGKSRREISAIVGLPYGSVNAYICLRKNGFDSYGDYRRNIAYKKGFISQHALQEDFARRKGYRTFYEYQKALVTSRTDPGILSDLVRISLENIGMTHRSFAERLGISYSYLSRILMQYQYPSKDLLERIYRTLGVE